MKTREQLQAYIDRLSKEYDDLVKKHGTGVRSSYVSTDLAILSSNIAKAWEELKLLDLDNPCDDWSGGYGKGQL